VGRSLAAIVLAGGLVAGGGGAGASAPTRTRPNADLTPGATSSAVTQENIQQTICTPGYTKSVRKVSMRTKSKVYAMYKIRKNDHSKYVIDHLIALQLGGSNNIKNLWPEKKKGAKGSDSKDDVEVRACSFECSRLGYPPRCASARARAPRRADTARWV
jgi:hypothetical protein